MTFPFLTRRDALRSISAGFGYMALAGLTTEAAAKEYVNPLSPKAPHFTPRAKRVIMLTMRGGPSHVDTFDYKPQLKADDGKSASGANKGRKLMVSPFKFPEQGESGLPISEIFPHVSKHADDLCLINGMHTDIPNHPQAFLKLHTGDFRLVRPSMGSWVLYGLGTENQNLPGFITIAPPTNLGGAQNYSSAFLPAIYQGTRIGNNARLTSGDGIGNVTNPHLSPTAQREQVDLIQAMNRDFLQRKEENLELEGVIESMELAFRMQSAVPEVMDISKESNATLARYGIRSSGPRTASKKGKAKKNAGGNSFGRQCLMARRLAEAGVRFIELAHSNWDQHRTLKASLTRNATAIDQPIGALIQDLKDRDMLKDTLVIWGGEFGRTPGVRRADGRDHNSTGFSMWMAGGGVRGGIRYGATDEHGIAAVEKRTHIHDLHATILHLLGLDHTKLTFRYSGRDFRLTDVHGNVATEILA